MWGNGRLRKQQNKQKKGAGEKEWFHSPKQFMSIFIIVQPDISVIQVFWQTVIGFDKTSMYRMIFHFYSYLMFNSEEILLQFSSIIAHSSIINLQQMADTALTDEVWLPAIEAVVKAQTKAWSSNSALFK